MAAQAAAEAEPESPNGAPPAAPDTADLAPPPPPRKSPLPLDLQKGEQVAQEIAANKSENTEVHWFREGQEDRFLGLFTPEYGKKAQGYAVILHDNQQHPNWPGVVRALRTQLPQGGWSTLSISLPDQWHIPSPPPLANEDPVATPPPSNDSADSEAPAPEPEKETPEPVNEMAAASADIPPPAQDDENAAADAGTPEPNNAKDSLGFTQLSVEYPLEKTPAIFQERVQEALAYLKAQKPMPIIIVSIGSSATMMAKQTHELRMKDIAGLVVIDPAIIDAIPNSEFNPDDDVPGLRIPVLDISPQFNPRSNPKQRKQNAKRLSRTTYEQQTITGSEKSFKGHENQVVKRIRGWAHRVIINKSRFGYL